MCYLNTVLSVRVGLFLILISSADNSGSKPCVSCSSVMRISSDMQHKTQHDYFMRHTFIKAACFHGNKSGSTLTMLLDLNV